VELGLVGLLFDVVAKACHVEAFEVTQDGFPDPFRAPFGLFGSLFQLFLAYHYSA
jgi:hypothetical protein